METTIRGYEAVEAQVMVDIVGDVRPGNDRSTGMTGLRLTASVEQERSNGNSYSRRYLTHMMIVSPKPGSLD